MTYELGDADTMPEKYQRCKLCGNPRMLRNRHFETGIELPEDWCVRCQDNFDRNGGQPNVEPYDERQIGLFE